MNNTIGFIGGGNMARSLIGGLLQGGHDPARIRVCEPSSEQRQRLSAEFAVLTSERGGDLLPGCECVVLAVKPQLMQTAIAENHEVLSKSQPLIISIAAGVRESSIRRWLQGDYPVVRCMPNTPALIQAGATALFANDIVNDEQRDLAESIMRTAGLTLWVDSEDLLDAVTAVSGSGPAYIFLVIEAMQAAGESLGLSREQSRLLCLQTAFGAAKMALEDPEPVEQLRRMVTSKGGTTEKALETFDRGGLLKLFEQAMRAAHARAGELAELLDRDNP